MQRETFVWLALMLITIVMTYALDGGAGHRSSQW